MDNFDVALVKFLNAIELKFGIGNGITKIGVSNELMRQISLEQYDKMKYSAAFENGELIIAGVHFVVREKDRF